MKRRNFFTVMGAASVTAAATSLPIPLMAAECSDELPITSEISNNHGHALSLNIRDVIELLRSTEGAPPASIDIQGHSGHPHSMVLTHNDLLLLLVEGEIEVLSSRDANHTHSVNAILEVI